ncbi:MAG: DUF1311 domain-containing protein [Deltaproteobacteria bacterium]|nr:DUF1311 domain-containing protein [Deltaproteobacteria bacterium]
MEMTLCRVEAANRTESLEAERYTRALLALGAKGDVELARTLEVIEQKWKDYRDAHCRTVGSMYAEGSMTTMIVADCRSRLAGERAAELGVVYLESGDTQ